LPTIIRGDGDSFSKKKIPTQREKTNRDRGLSNNDLRQHWHISQIQQSDIPPLK